MPRYETVFKCDTCGLIIPCGKGAGAKVNEHEATFPDPEVHWMQYEQIEVAAK